VAARATRSSSGLEPLSTLHGRDRLELLASRAGLAVRVGEGELSVFQLQHAHIRLGAWLESSDLGAKVENARCIDRRLAQGEALWYRILSNPEIAQLRSVPAGLWKDALAHATVASNPAIFTVDCPAVTKVFHFPDGGGGWRSSSPCFSKRGRHIRREGGFSGRIHFRFHDLLIFSSLEFRQP